MSNEQTTPLQRTKGRAKRGLPRRLRLALFLVPALTGFLLAYAILEIAAPFRSHAEWLLTLTGAIVASLIMSMVTGGVVRKAVKKTAMYKESNQFETVVDELFGTYLREGSARNLRRDATARDLDSGLIDDVIEQLSALTQHDRLTRGHVERVRAYSSMLGREHGLTQPELELLNWTAMLHDIGKLDVPASILNSPGRPSAEEWAVLRTHPEAARGRLTSIEKVLGERIYDGVLYHHERWDGNGYPHGVAGTDIPLFGRIVAIADAFDVMTHARSYKAPRPVSEARDELIASAGTHFDPELVNSFARIGDQELKDVRGWSATLAGFSVVGSRLATIGTNAAIIIGTITGAAFVTAVDNEVGPPPNAVAFIAAEEVDDEPEPRADPVETSTTTTTTTTTILVETTTSTTLPVAAPFIAPTTPSTTTSTSTTTSSAPTTAAPQTTRPPATAPSTTVATAPPSTPAPTTTAAPVIVEVPTVEQRELFFTYQVTSHVIDGFVVSVDPDQVLVYLNGALHTTIDLAPGQTSAEVAIDVTGLRQDVHLVRFESFDDGELVSVDDIAIPG